MKVFVIFLVLFTVSFLTVNHVYGIWLPQSPEELLEESQLIVVGNITSVNELEYERSSSYIITENGVDKEVIENYPLILDEYTITVEEFVKNPQDTDTITVRQPTVSTPGKLVPHGGFEIGDRVLFYIESFDGTNTYSKESFLIPKQCETSSVIHEPRIIGSDYTMMQNGIEKNDNFTANIPIRFIAKSDTGTLSGNSPSIEYDAFISKQVGKIYKERVFHQTITADVKPCEWLSVAEWEFTPDAGNYLLNGRIYENGNNLPIGNKFFSVLPETPLKQIQSGVSPNQIQCRERLVLIQKYDGSPACVTESTKQKLIERGWTGITKITEESLERYTNLPEVAAFYETYEDAQVSVREGHVSYFAGSNDGYFVRMNLFFDENHSITDVDFHCYYQRVHQYEIPQDDIAPKIAKYDCKEHGETLGSEPKMGFDDSTDLKSKNSFAFDFYSKIAEQNQGSNLFFSPLSISMAFSLAYEGADGKTSQQMQEAFGFVQDDQKRRTMVSGLLETLDNEDDLYKLSVANALWVKDGYNIKQGYLDVAALSYNSTVENVNFVTDDGIDRINEWVAQKTEKKIQKILAPGSTDELTRMVITNAVYFKGKWALQFNQQKTSQELFWPDESRSVKVLMMKEPAAIFNYAETQDLKALEMNYLGGDISMLVLLPKDKNGIGSLEDSLDRKKLDSIRNMMERQPLTVQIPKFEFETEYGLIGPMRDMGVQDAFDKNNANFGGITDEQVYIDQAKHKAFVNVNEEGTEAAAITALVARATSGPPEPQHEFIADHPFVFLIQEKETGQILFLGRVVDPTQ